MELQAEKMFSGVAVSGWLFSLFFFHVYKTICERPLKQLSSNNVL